METVSQKNPTIKGSTLEGSIDKLMLVLALMMLILIPPYFVWGNLLVIFRITHLIGNLILLYIFVTHNNYVINNFRLVLLFLFVSVYSMIGGTENKMLSYIPLLALLFISLKPDQHLRVYKYFIDILTIIYSVGLISYLLSIAGLNIQIGTAIAPNPAKFPYSVFFGHVEEASYPIFRFASIFDEPGVVGTINGLILSAIGISTRNARSLIILIAGIASFSLAFYIILILNLLLKLDMNKLLLGVIIFTLLFFMSGDRFDFNELIIDRLGFKSGFNIDDNRTTPAFDTYFDIFIMKGGNDLFYGKGPKYVNSLKEGEGVSSYKMAVVNYGLLGVGLIIMFYAAYVLQVNNSKSGWFLFLIFIISGYQRPELLAFYNIALFIGGLHYLNQVELNKPRDQIIEKPRTRLEALVK